MGSGSGRATVSSMLIILDTIRRSVENILADVEKLINTNTGVGSDLTSGFEPQG